MCVYTYKRTTIRRKHMLLLQSFEAVQSAKANRTIHKLYVHEKKIVFIYPTTTGFKKPSFPNGYKIHPCTELPQPTTSFKEETNSSFNARPRVNRLIISKEALGWSIGTMWPAL